MRRPAPNDLSANTSPAVPTLCTDGLTPWPWRGADPPPPYMVPVPLQCCSCGVSTPPEGAHHPEGGKWPYPAAGYAGRVCDPCFNLVERSDPGDAISVQIAILAELLPDESITATDQACRSVAAKHVRILTDAGKYAPGRASRWEHLDPSVLRVALLDEWRRRNPTAQPSPNGLACGGCGVRKALQWRAGVMHAATAPPPGKPALLPLCGACDADIGALPDRSLGFDWTRRLAMRAYGIAKGEFGDWRIENFAPFGELDPFGPGYERPFSWLETPAP